MFELRELFWSIGAFCLFPLPHPFFCPIHHPSSVIHHHQPCSKCTKIYSLFQTLIFFKDKIKSKNKIYNKKESFIFKGIILEHLEHLEHFAPPIYFCLILAESPGSTPSLLSSPNPRQKTSSNITHKRGSDCARSACNYPTCITLAEEPTHPFERIYFYLNKLLEDLSQSNLFE